MNDHILHQKDKARISTPESEGWTTPVALHWTRISCGNHALPSRFQLGTHSFDLRARFRRYSWQKASGVSCIPSSHFPHPKGKTNTQHPWHMLRSCGKWAGALLSSANRRSGHTADRWILITGQQHRHGAPFPLGAPFPSHSWTASGWT